MERYKLFIHTYNNLEREHFLNKKYIGTDGHYICRNFPFIKTVHWNTYRRRDIRIRDVWEYRPADSGECEYYSAELFNKLFMNGRCIIEHDKYKDVINIPTDSPLEVRYASSWYRGYALSPREFYIEVALRDLEINLYRVFTFNRPWHINLFDGIVLFDISAAEYMAIKWLSMVRDTTHSITKEEFEHYNNISREEAINELALEYISTL